MKECRILILDFGSQYTQLLLRRIREFGVYSKLYCWENNEKSQIFKFNPAGIILSGGPFCSVSVDAPSVPQYIYDLGIPILGICYGMQIMAIQLGGKIDNSALYCEFGNTKISVLERSSILMNDIYDFIDDNNRAVLNVWMSHKDTVTVVPKNFSVVAVTTISSQIAVMSDERRNFYGVQFHPEVTHTKKGNDILRRFVLEICKCKSYWKPKNIIDDIVSNIRLKVKCDGVILGISGGIDSLITALLLQRAIDCQLTCVMIDTGLLRYNEINDVVSFFRKNYNLKIIVLFEENKFFDALHGIKDPEKKRKIIGKVFVDIFEKQAKSIDNIKWLAQGTIYSDIIESGNLLLFSKKNIIKSHHNVGGIPKKMNLKLLEPIKYLFKDEVRKIGLNLGIPYDIVYRHPFPGPGLAIRILGEVKREYRDLVRRVDLIFLEELRRFDLYKNISQAFSVFLPVCSVGIQGDCRKYGWVVSLRAVKTVDFMTAQWVYFSYKFLETVSSRIINEIKDVSRVVYDISNKPPATVEWE